MERTPANTDPVRSEQQRQDWTSTIFVNPLFNLKTGPAPSLFSTFLLRLDQPLHSTQGQGWTSTILLLNPISSTVGLDQCTSSQTSSSITWLDPVLISILLRFSHPCSPSPLVSPENLSLVSHHHHHCHCQCHWLVDAGQTTVKHFVKFLPPSAIEDLTQR